MNRAGQGMTRSGRVALLLCAGAVAGLTLVRAAVSMLALEGVAAILMQAAGLVLFTLLPSVLGLLVLDGDQTRIVRLQTLSAAQIALYAATGILAVFPASVLGGLLGRLSQSLVAEVSSTFAALAASTAANDAPALGPSLFLPMLLCHALLAPVGEELFFRGYLMGVWESGAQKTATIAVALLFALSHGLGSMTPVYLLLGLLFALLTQRSNSVLAAMLAHAGYNGALVSLEFLGAGALMDVSNLLACAVLLLGSAAFVAVLWRALALRPGVKRARFWDGRGLSRKEIALLAGAALALVASLIVGGMLA